MSAVSADDQSLYWMEFKSDNNAKRNLMRMMLPGGTPVVMTTLSSGDFFIDNVDLYWSESVGNIFRMPVMGGAAATLASGLGTMDGLVADDTSLYWLSSGSLMTLPKAGGVVTAVTDDYQITSYLLIDGDYIYFGDEFAAIVRLSKSGGIATRFPTANSPALLLGVRNGALYYTFTTGSGTTNVARMTIDGGRETVVFPALTPTLGEPALDGMYLYWQDGQRLMRRSLEGSDAPVKIAEGYSRFTLVGQWIYLWGSGAQLMTIAKILKEP